jgi:thioredoxin 1
MHAIVELTAATFDAEIGRPGLTVVDYWAPWCAPCLALAPHFERVAQLRPQYRFAKVNVDDHPQLANAFGISSIPTLLILRDGAPVTMAIGGIVPEQFADALDRLAA